MTRFADALVVDVHLLRAAEQAAEQALDSLGSSPDLVCCFVSGALPDEAAAAAGRVAQVTAGAAVLGASAAGVVGGARGVEGRPAVSVLAGVLPDASIRTFHLECLQGDSGTAVVGLPDPAPGEVAMLLADPYSFPAAGFVSRSSDSLPGLPVVGALAGTGQGPGSSRLHVDGRTVDRGAVGALLGGAGASVLVSQGCRGIGPAMTVTAAAGNVVRGLAGEPALDRVQRLLAELPPEEQALASSGLHLGLAADEYGEDQDFLVRPVLGTERPTGGLVVGDLVAVGSTVRLHVRDAELADAELRQRLLAHRLDRGSAPVAGALLFTCNGRGEALFGPGHGGADHDPVLVQQGLAPQGLAGLFSAGELGPVAGRNALHGLTACLLTFPGP